jgi:hypothetical protein
MSQAALSSSRNCSTHTRDSAIQSRTTPCSASGLPKTTRASARAHIKFDGPFGDANDAHAAVDPSRVPGRRDLCLAAAEPGRSTGGGASGRRQPDCYRPDLVVTPVSSSGVMRRSSRGVGRGRRG